MKIYKLVFVSIFLAVLFLFAPGKPVLAACGDDVTDPLGVDCGAASGLEKTDIRLTVARIVRAALGLLGIVALVLIVYAGFTWMTAGGEEDKINTAKKTLYAAVIGLAIILSAYGITGFILTQLYRTTVGTQTYVL